MTKVYSSATMFKFQTTTIAIFCSLNFSLHYLTNPRFWAGYTPVPTWSIVYVGVRWDVEVRVADLRLGPPSSSVVSGGRERAGCRGMVVCPPRPPPPNPKTPKTREILCARRITWRRTERRSDLWTDLGQIPAVKQIIDSFFSSNDIWFRAIREESKGGARLSFCDIQILENSNFSII